MNDLTLKLFSTTRGLLYEKTFAASEVLAPYVRQALTALVSARYLAGDEKCWALVTPLYPSLPQSELTIPQPTSATSSEWLALVLPEGAPLEEEIRRFRAEIHLVPETGHAYRADFTVPEIDELVSRVKDGLAGRGIIEPGEQVHPGWYANGGNVSAGQEIVHRLPADLDDIYINLDDEAPEERPAERPLPACLCHPSRSDYPEDFVVFFQEKLLEQLEQFVRNTTSRDKEIGGILIGDLFRETAKERQFIVVEDFIPADQTQSSAVFLTFTHQTWQDLIARKNQLFEPSKRILGWYHTHPPIPVTLAGKSVYTVQFFSSADVSVHQQMFREPWQVALVMDAGSSERVLYRWSGAKLVTGELHVIK